MNPRSRRPATGPAPALLALLLAGAATAQMSLPVHVAATVDATALAATGRATLRLEFSAEATPDEPYAVRVELRTKGRILQRRDHAPPVPTRRWRPNEPVRYELTLFFPLATSDSGQVEVLLGFLDPADAAHVRPPLTRERPRDGLAKVAEFALPDLGAAPDATAVDAAIAAATALAKKEPQAAWDQLEFVFRRLDDYRLKAKLQQALLQVGRMPPAPLTFEEQGIVAGRIRAERARYLRQVAGRLYDRGKLFGALVLLDEVGGALQEDADKAVLGALADAQRVTKDRDGIAAQVFALGKEQEAEVERLVDEHPKDEERLQFALGLAKNPKRRAVGRELLRKLEWVVGFEQRAADARRELERAWLAEVPAEERAEADAARNHPCWARTGQRVSHRFVLIGPERLLAAIPADSLLRFDLAYLWLTDLFGRVPNPDGDRVTVYFKELWEFGGGVGGGKIIDVGSVDPTRRIRASTPGSTTTS